MAAPCGHTFCGQCVARLKQSARVRCALCQQPVAQFLPNIFARRLFSKEMAKCKFCEAAFSLDQAKDHTRQCAEVELSCTLCRDSLKRKEQTAHTSQCPMWPVKCECGETYRQLEKARHEIVCSFEKIKCPLDCDTWVER